MPTSSRKLCLFELFIRFRKFFRFIHKINICTYARMTIYSDIIITTYILVYYMTSVLLVAVIIYLARWFTNSNRG